MSDRNEHMPGTSLVTNTVLLKEMQSGLEYLEREDLSTHRHLCEILDSQHVLQHDLGRLDLARAQAGVLTNSARNLSEGTILTASVAAQRISGAVKELDVEQGRVKSTLEVVEMVSDLKDCVLGVMGSMGAPQDWETAAAYLHRASRIPPTIVNGTFAESIVPTAEVPDPPATTITQAAESLKILFLKEFERAAVEGNGSKVTRFFKLFPLIGKPEVGLDVYGRYVCQGVAARARANLLAGESGTMQAEPLFFASALTKLFENVAQIVDNHGGLVERHYGSGQMVRVIERLQVEADLQGGIILDTWTDERHVDRKLRDLRSYAFTFLVQSFLPAPVPRSSTPRPESPARRRPNVEVTVAEDDAIDMKDIDNLTNEMTLMLSRWSLYCKFLANKCDAPDESPGVLAVPPVISKSGLLRKIAERLISPFNITMAFYLRRSVEKAFQLDEQPAGLSLDEEVLRLNPPFITSAVDDVMYIVSRILDKAIQTSQKAVVAIIVPTISRVLSSDFIGMIQRKLRDEHYPRAAARGGTPPDTTIIAFLVLLNNLDMTIEYTNRIVNRHMGKLSVATSQESDQPKATSLENLFPMERDATFVRESLAALQNSFSAKAFELIADGISVAFKNIFKARIRLVISEAFRDVGYDSMQEGINQSRDGSEKDVRSFQGDNAVAETFRLGWERFNNPLLRILTGRNSQKLLALLAGYLSEILEKRIWSFHGRVDHLGAVKMERDIAGIVNVVIRGGNYRLREIFARCAQICLVMNMEEEAWEGLGADPSNKEREESEWQLDAEERSRARAMVNTGKAL